MIEYVTEVTLDRPSRAVEPCRALSRPLNFMAPSAHPTISYIYRPK